MTKSDLKHYAELPNRAKLTLKLYLLSTKACAGADGTQVLLLPLVAHLVGFTIVIAH